MNRLLSRRRRHDDRFGAIDGSTGAGFAKGGGEGFCKRALLGDGRGDLLVADRVRRAHLHRDHVEKRLVVSVGVLRCRALGLGAFGQATLGFGGLTSELGHRGSFRGFCKHGFGLCGRGSGGCSLRTVEGFGSLLHGGRCDRLRGQFL